MANNTTKETTNAPKKTENPLTPRFQIARGVLFASIGAIFVITVVALFMVETVDDKKYVFATVLPMFATWVGIILAYYFSGENFESATQSIKEMAQQLTPKEKLESIPVKAKMIGLGVMEKLNISPSKTVAQINIMDDILKFFDTKKRNRLPILDENSHPKFIIHRSMVDKYLTQKVAQGLEITATQQLTLSNLFTDDPQLKTIFEKGFAIVPATATLGSAKEEMEKVKNCLDVFVTEKGSRDEPVMGWITNLIITENAKL